MAVYERHNGGEERHRAGEGSAGRPNLATGTKTKREKAGARPKVLARLPNFDLEELDRIVDADPPASSKRPLGQKISTAVLVGVGTLFLVVAIQPYLKKSPRGLQPPAPSAPAAPAWDAMAARSAPATAKQAPSVPSVPVSIPALPSSIPSVPEGIEGPAAGPVNPSGIPVPSWNKHSQAPAENVPAATAPPSVSLPGMAEVSEGPASPKPAPAIAPLVSNVPTSMAPAEPGVARFQGVIESTQRPSYDATRSSLR